MLCLLLGCALSQEQRMARKEAKAVSTVSVASTLFRPQRGQSFAWHSPIIWAGDFENRDNSVLGAVMIEALEKELTKRGYVMAKEKSEADYIIGTVVMNGGAESSKSLSEFFHTFPGLDESTQGYDAAIALVGVVDSHSPAALGEQPLHRKAILWRSALEAYLLGDQLSQKDRKKRVRTLVKKLMISFPQS